MRGADVAPPHSRFPAPLRSTTRGLPTTRYGYEGSLCATVAVPLGRQAGVLSGPAVTPKAQDKTIASRGVIQAPLCPQIDHASLTDRFLHSLTDTFSSLHTIHCSCSLSYVLGTY